MRAVERRGLAAGDLLAITVLEDHLGRALDEQHLPTIRELVERRHELVLRFEGNGVDARGGRLLGLPIEA